VKSGKSEKTAATESGISSEAGRSLDFTSTEGVSTRRSPPTNPEMTPDATARADGATDVNVSPHRFGSMIWSGLSQEVDQSPLGALDDSDSLPGEWSQVTARKNRKSRKQAEAKEDVEAKSPAGSTIATHLEQAVASWVPYEDEVEYTNVPPACPLLEKKEKAVEVEAAPPSVWVPYEDEVEYTNVPIACPLKDPLDEDPQPEVKMPDGACPWATLLRDEGGGFDDIPASRNYFDDVEYPDTDEEVMYGWY
jgi:hypothetical protein